MAGASGCTKVNVLAMEIYAARFDHPPFWTPEENEEKAHIAKTSRLAAAHGPKPSQ